jgi:preprotein translocase subunit SecG
MGLLQYLVALKAHWLSLGTGTVLAAMIEWLGAEACPVPRAVEIREWLSRSRHVLAVVFIVIGFAFANFQMWQDDQEQLRIAKDKGSDVEALKSEIIGLKKWVWTPLSPDEALAVRVKLRDLEKPEWSRIVCTSAQCIDLANSLVALFIGLGWSPRLDQENIFHMEPGVTVYYPSPQIEDALNLGTHNRLKAKTHTADTNTRSVAVEIGPKPGD